MTFIQRNNYECAQMMPFCLEIYDKNGKTNDR